jgi:hypothetical protein
MKGIWEKTMGADRSVPFCPEDFAGVVPSEVGYFCPFVAAPARSVPLVPDPIAFWHRNCFPMGTGKTVSLLHFRYLAPATEVLDQTDEFVCDTHH